MSEQFTVYLKNAIAHFDGRAEAMKAWKPESCVVEPDTELGIVVAKITWIKPDGTHETTVSILGNI